MTGRADIRRYSGGVRLEFSLLAKTDVVDCWSKAQRLLATWLFLLLADGSQTLQICWTFLILPLVCYFPLKDGLARVHSRSDFAHLLDCKGVSLTPQHADTPDAPPEMKVPSNCANHLCHAEGEPREPVLTLNEVKGKDGVVGVRVFSALPS